MVLQKNYLILGFKPNPTIYVTVSNIIHSYVEYLESLRGEGGIAHNGRGVIH